MESLNLNTLASSLPNAYQNAEKELLTDFKAAALSITTFYRSSRRTSKRAYNAGYAAACQDLLMMIQQGVSVGGIGSDPSGSTSSHEVEGGGMTIGRVMDWIEARLDAIKSREEEEDEDEEKEKERERERAPPTAGTKPDNKTAKPPVQSASATRPKDQNAPSLPTPNSPRSNSNPQPTSHPPSPSPPPSTMTLRPIHHPPQRHSKYRPIHRGDAMDRSNPPDNAFTGGLSSTSPAQLIGFPENPIPIAAGAKRRHAVMMMLDGTSSPISIGGTPPGGTTHPFPSAANNAYLSGVNHTVAGAGGSRRRTRSSRGTPHSQNQNLNPIQASEAMDVEEDGGRERKRVSRR